MDEFDKIRELSEDITKYKEPSFSNTSLPENDFLSEDCPISPLSDIRETIEKDIDFQDKSFSFLNRGFIVVIVFFILIGIVLLGIYLSRNEDEQIDPILITASSEPIKVKPENPGGLVIPDQDKLVYSRLRAHELPVKIEKLFPEPERPVLPVAQEKEETQETTVDTIVPTKPTKPAAIKSEKTDKTNTSTKSVKNDKWRVQLFSSSKKDAVSKAWTKILNKNKSLLSNMSHDIISAEISGKGVFYRLQVGQFNSREQANTLCQKLKANKQDCVPVKP